jgi:nicotinamide-nucleotide amidase
MALHADRTAAADEPLIAGLADAELVALAERLQGLCLGRGLTVATAESCTGGLLGAVITSIAGSSGHYRGGVVAYADDAKRSLLGVGDETLAAHGAVSAQVAMAMALGIRDRLVADLAVSVTGIAGPAGGSEAKPVGSTYLGLASSVGIDVRHHVFHSDRDGNRRAAAIEALTMLLEAAEATPSR